MSALVIGVPPYIIAGIVSEISTQKTLAQTYRASFKYNGKKRICQEKTRESPVISVRSRVEMKCITIQLEVYSMLPLI